MWKSPNIGIKFQNWAFFWKKDVNYDLKHTIMAKMWACILL